MNNSLNNHTTVNNHSANSMLGWARFYAAFSIPTFPLPPGNKIPGFSDWPEKASLDRLQHERWFARGIRGPHKNIGVLCGGGVFVLDVDVKSGKDGVESLRLLERKFGDTLPVTLTVRTPSGGLHYYFDYDPSKWDVRNSVEKLGSGLDIRGERGFVVGAGSRIQTDNGKVTKEYRKEVDADIATAPNWLLRLVCDNHKRGAKGPNITTQEWGDNHRDALWSLDSDSYDSWIEAGMACRGSFGDAGFDLWHEWSRRSQKYAGVSDCAAKWASFSPREDGITFGTVIYRARENGAVPVTHAIPNSKDQPSFNYTICKAHETADWGDVSPIVEHFLYGDGFTLLYAREGCGKSAVAFYLACSIAIGGEFFGEKALQRPVFYIITERKRQFPRLLRGYCDETNIDAEDIGRSLFLTADYVDLFNPDCVAVLKDEINKLEGTFKEPIVIVVDSLYFAMGAGDVEKQKDVMTVTRSVLKTIIDERQDRACVIVHHKGKSAGNEQFGSSAFSWVADVKARVDKGENDVFQIGIEKNSYNDDAGRYEKRFRIVDTKNGFGIRQTDELAVVSQKRTPISELLFNALIELIDEEGVQLPNAPAVPDAPDAVVEHQRLKDFVRALDIIKGDTAEQFAKNYSVHWAKLKKHGRVRESGPYVWPVR